MPKAISPYHVSPVDGVWIEMLSLVSGAGATAYHVCMNCPPPIGISPVLWINSRPAVSLTENVPPKQSQPTIITSGFVVVSDTEQDVTYPHEFFALPSSDGRPVPVDD
jgi:hypothetical protein